MKRGKNYNEALEKIDREKVYHPGEAVSLIKEIAKAKFDETVEAHLRLGVDARKAEQQVRGTLVLPHGTGKSAKVLVFAQGEKVKEAEEAGADFVGVEELVAKIEKGWTDFDAAVATPDVMSKVGKIGKVLGPRGLMPNPKAGTVTFDVAKAVTDIKKGKVEYRVDEAGIIHTTIGKTSFPESSLLENYAALVEEVVRSKPAAAKGKYIKSITLVTTMGPGIRVDESKTRDVAAEKAPS